MPTKQFIRDRRRGRPAQDYVAGMLRSWGLTVREIPEGYFPGWDQEVEGQLHGNFVRFKCEVKYDRRSTETGNFALELDALSHSKAGILAICTGDPIDKTYMLPLQDALSFARSWPIKKSVGERGEVATLVPIPTFIVVTSFKYWPYTHLDFLLDLPERGIPSLLEGLGNSSGKSIESKIRAST